VVDHVLTIAALESVRAHAGVARGVAVTGGLVLARVVRRADVIGVEFAVHSFEPVDADAFIATLGVLAGGVVLARPGGGALVHILAAVFPSPVDRAVTGVGVHSIQALAPVLTKVALAVVSVHLAVSTLKP